VGIENLQNRNRALKYRLTGKNYRNIRQKMFDIKNPHTAGLEKGFDSDEMESDEDDEKSISNSIKHQENLPASVDPGCKDEGFEAETHLFS
jgi:hypothetical protein